MIPKARFVLSRKRLSEQYAKLKEAGLTVSYSIKTNNDVARVLEKETDSFFSVHTKEELNVIEDNSKIWFLAESWDMAEIDDIIGSGIRNFVVYNVSDLEKLEKSLTGKDLKINLLLRGKLRENTIFTEKYFVFGMDSTDLNASIKRLRKNTKIGKLGLHFHRKTQNVGEWDLKYEVENMLDAESLNMIDIVNMGGGLPLKYRNTGDDSLPFIFKKINELRDFLGGHGIELFIEPGRFLCGASVMLETYAKSINGKNITVNCSVYNTSPDTLIMPLKMLVEGELPKGGKNYLIKGCTPCSMDIFRYSVNLPEKKIGDRIVFINAGAYNFHTEFCSLEKLKTVIVD
jgi:ornithine decarboxylase